MSFAMSYAIAQQTIIFEKKKITLEISKEKKCVKNESHETTHVLKKNSQDGCRQRKNQKNNMD